MRDQEFTCLACLPFSVFPLPASDKKELLSFILDIITPDLSFTFASLAIFDSISLEDLVRSTSYLKMMLLE